MAEHTDLTELSRIEQAATAAPWRYRPSMFDDWGVIRGGDHSPVATSCMECRYDHTTDVGKPEGPSPIPQNGELIVAMRNALPGMIAELTELRAENVRWAMVAAQTYNLSYGPFLLVQFDGNRFVAYREGLSAFNDPPGSFGVKYFPSAAAALDACDALLAAEKAAEGDKPH